LEEGKKEERKKRREGRESYAEKLCKRGVELI
jgi:hypothetical protein